MSPPPPPPPHPDDVCRLCRGTKRAFGKPCVLCGGSGSSKAAAVADPAEKRALLERERALAWLYRLRLDVDETIAGVKSGKQIGSNRGASKA
jgi:hypothetical protein